MKTAVGLFACLLVLTLALSEGKQHKPNKHPKPDHGEEHSPSNGNGESAQNGNGNPPQDGNGNSPQNGNGNSPQNGNGNSPQNGNGNSQTQTGTGDSKKQGDKPTTQEQRELDDLVNKLRNKLSGVLNKAGSDKLGGILSGKKQGILDAVKGGDKSDVKGLRDALKKLKDAIKEGRKQKGGKNEEEDSEEDGSGEIEKELKGSDEVVKIEEVKGLLGEISSLVDRVDVPLQAIKSDLVDKVSQINNAEELAFFLRQGKKEFRFPLEDFKDMIRTSQNIMSRLFKGYETDPDCINFKEEVEKMIPESGELSQEFHKEFIQKYLLSVSCLSGDNAQFKSDLSMLQELNEGSGRDEVLAAISKALAGSLRLMDKMAEQDRVLRYIMSKLPKGKFPDNPMVYRSLLDD